ncbi:putative la-type HTH domain, winged helix-like DNA-binding domain superfamily [Helianthus annuus]|nr:putative la-type HTH domain, winged helix-like DNA-binding domain superfamily [Helianthus annuus]KAJ0662148.1 putative la-type HTH domain, winged helix-like DNA-binding domain superfamily [Helianthus annuus]
MTADSSTATVTHSADNDAGKTLPSPWLHVVRGPIHPDSISPPPLADERVSVSSDPVAPPLPEVSDGNADGVVKSAWSKPLVDGVVEGVTVSPVMGADLWPALSESTRPGVKSSFVSSESSSKPAIDASAQEPVISQPPQKQAKPNLNSNNNPIPPPFPVFDMYGNLLPPIPEPPQAPFKVNNWSPRPVDSTSNRQPPARRNNFGPRPFNNGYGGRREHHAPRSPAGAARDVNVPHQMAPPPPPPFRGYFRPPFLFPQPVRPYGAPMGYEMGGSYVYFPALAPAPYRGGAPVYPHGASVSSMPMSSVDLSLHDEILKQIEYYFSDDNLVKDNYLRSHMDEEGWVSITLIAGFPKVQALTNDIQMLLSVLRDSSTCEIQDDKVRRRADWKRWIHTRREVTENSVEEASLQKLSLEDGPTNEEQVLANGDVSPEDPCS